MNTASSILKYVNTGIHGEETVIDSIASCLMKKEAASKILTPNPEDPVIPKENHHGEMNHCQVQTRVDQELPTTLELKAKAMEDESSNAVVMDPTSNDIHPLLVPVVEEEARTKTNDDHRNPRSESSIELMKPVKVCTTTQRHTSKQKRKHDEIWDILNSEEDKDEYDVHSSDEVKPDQMSAWRQELDVGSDIDARCPKTLQWLPARVVALLQNPESEEDPLLEIKYHGWNDRYNVKTVRWNLSLAPYQRRSMAIMDDTLAKRLARNTKVEPVKAAQTSRKGAPLAKNKEKKKKIKSTYPSTENIRQILATMKHIPVAMKDELIHECHDSQRKEEEHWRKNMKPGLVIDARCNITFKWLKAKVESIHSTPNPEDEIEIHFYQWKKTFNIRCSRYHPFLAPAETKTSNSPVVMNEKTTEKKSKCTGLNRKSKKSKSKSAAHARALFSRLSAPVRQVFQLPFAIIREMVKKPPAFQRIQQNLILVKDNRKYIDEHGEATCLCKKKCDDNCINYLSFTECYETKRESNCVLGSTKCRNRALQRRESPRLQVTPYEDKGWGLRVDEPVAAGKFIIEYVGEVISNEMKIARLDAHRREHPFDHNMYLMHLGDSKFIDARFKSNNARFINHSCAPNCELQKWTVGRVNRIAIVSLRPLEALEELTYDYQFHTSRATDFKCHCQAPACRGTLAPKRIVDMVDTGGKDTKSSTAKTSSIDMSTSAADPDLDQKRIEKENRKIRRAQAEILKRLNYMDTDVLPTVNGAPAMSMIFRLGPTETDCDLALASGLFLVRNVMTGYQFIDRKNRWRHASARKRRHTKTHKTRKSIGLQPLRLNVF